MPERVVALSEQVSSLATQKVAQIRNVTQGTRILSLNAAIEATRAGEAGAGFTVVAREVGEISAKIEKLADELNRQLAAKTAELHKLGQGLVANIRGSRLADLALNMVDIINRNQYERTCDVRWWATGNSVVGCVSKADTRIAEHASERLGVILDSYTVYLDIWVADRDGKVVASGRPARYTSVRGSSVAREEWFQRAMKTQDGTDYVACDIAVNSALNNARVCTYSTAIREGAKRNGAILGVIGVFFDWEKLSQAVVGSVRLTAEERGRTRCLILDSRHRIIASSDHKNIFETWPLDTRNADMGNYVDKSGDIVGFALTPGYENYAGLGWYGVLVQSRTV